MKGEGITMDATSPEASGVWVVKVTVIVLPAVAGILSAI
jgi:hypothetical protein